MSTLSFFPLAARRPAPREDDPLLALTPDAFDTFHAEASPLFDALVETVNAYSAAHPGLSLMAVYIAADILHDMLTADLREADADA